MVLKAEDMLPALWSKQKMDGASIVNFSWMVVYSRNIHDTLANRAEYLWTL
jgi:hypothetical protein